MSAPGLPSKEAGIFKRLIKFFDDRKYKDVLRMARQIMSNSACQNHPETLCLKGIALINLDQKAEGQEAVKRGLALGIKSALCWHMFGVMHRHERTYVEAIKAYSQAVKLDKNVGQYYKEMSNMYLLLRDFEGYYQTRKKLLQERPNIVSNWCEFAFAAYVRKDYDETDAILTNFTKINKSDDVHALGELLSFHVVVLTEKAVASQNTDHFQAAFDFLTKHNAQIQDTAFRLESTAFLSAQLADRERAEAAHRALLAFNAENVDYFKRYHKLVFPDASADEARILAFYDQLTTDFPKSRVAKRLVLEHASGAEFEARITPYLHTGLTKGAPPLYTSLASLFAVPAKAGIIQRIVEQFHADLTQAPPAASTSELPCTLVWAKYFLARLYDDQGKHAAALEMLNSAIQHTPTLLELYTAKAKVYKHAGCPEGAAFWQNHARELDTADKYLGSKAAKYALLNGDLKHADYIMGLFCRAESIEPDAYLFRMQCSWYHIAAARANLARGEFGEALVRAWTVVDTSFVQYYEDQYDFFTYLAQRSNLRSLARLVAFENSVQKHRYHRKACFLAIETYLRAHDAPLIAAAKAETELAKLSPKARKKFEAKKKKEAAVANANAQTAASSSASIKDDKKPASGQPKVEFKNKYDAAVLGKTPKPLDDAKKFLKLLQTYSLEFIETHLLAFELAFRKGKPVLMLQSLKRASTVNRLDAKLHLNFVKFLKFWETKSETLTAPVKTVLLKELSVVLGSDVIPNAASFNQRALEDPSTSRSLPHLLAVAQGWVFLDAGRIEDSVTLATSLADDLVHRDLKTCSEVVEFLHANSVDAARITDYKTACRAFFPLASAFDARFEVPVTPLTATTSVASLAASVGASAAETTAP
eukprot:m.175597 g.175597  ORF g.175597 m.175597 type:complete len:877 (+) comp53323_c0_seq1:80-2710(+)